MGKLGSIANTVILVSFLFFVFIDAETQSPPENMADYDEMANGFRPNLAIVIVILAIMFFVTFLLLIYAKFCHRPNSSDLFLADETGREQRLGGRVLGRSSRFSGIDKKVIESLPYFRFSSLEGERKGLECAVCLSKFEDIELLRLLPKCKHAFHIDCVDRWLESHSSCPLCRHKVDASDLTMFTNSDSLRISRNPSDLTYDPNIELFVRREQDTDINQGVSLSSMFSIGSSFRRIEKGKNDEELPIQVEQPVIGGEYGGHEFNHSILVSDVVFKNRWSDVDSSDLMLLNSEMFSLRSSRSFSDRFIPASVISDNGSSSNEKIMKIKEEMERKKVFESKLNKIKRSYSFSSKSNFPSASGSESSPSNPPGILVPSGARSLSEMNISRFPDQSMKNRIRESLHQNGQDERVSKVWIPIARQTVQWLADREKRPQEHQFHPQQPFNV